jgi:hypothetical protein
LGHRIPFSFLSWSLQEETQKPSHFKCFLHHFSQGSERCLKCFLERYELLKSALG